METRTYTAKVINSFNPLEGIAKLKVKDTSDAIKIDELLKENPEFDINIDNVIIVSVHNDRAKDGQNKDYEQYIILDTDGRKYVTGSTSLFTALSEIRDDLLDIDMLLSDVVIKIFTKPSKQYSGKYFITAAIR